MKKTIIKTCSLGVYVELAISISNFYHAPSHDNFYGFNEHNSRNVNQFALPPQPSAIMVPPPPPNTHSANTINANSGSVGQHFGNFGPTPPQL